MQCSAVQCSTVQYSLVYLQSPDATETGDKRWTDGPLCSYADFTFSRLDQQKKYTKEAGAAKRFLFLFPALF